MTDRTQTATAAGTPFVGREAELDQLLRALAETVQRRGCVALVGGEPGIGKSRLADQLAIRAREEGMRTLVGQSWEGAGAPAYWPWVQVFRTIIRTTDDAVLRHQLGAGAADIAQMVVELRETLGDLPDAGEVESESARFQLFDSATMFLRRAAKANPLLIVIDDLHAADMPTILYLRFVASQLADAPIMVVCTYREMELAADPALATAVGEIARQPGTLSLSLGGLGEASVRQLIEATAGVSPRSNLLNAIVRETGGNPLFLGEAVRLLAAEGRLGEVATGQTLDLPLPAGIRDVIIRRVRHLPAETADLLIHAAALGPEFITEVLRRVTDSSPGEVLDRIGEASRAGLVAPVPGTLGRFRFTHDLIRETLYDELPPGRRVSLHRRIADTLQAQYGPAPEAYLAELAHHYVEASRGGTEADSDQGSIAELAVHYARDAGDLALRSLAYEEAARLYRMGLAVLELHAPGDTERHIEMLLRLGEAEARAGDLPASRETYLEAAELARGQGAAESLARAVLGYGGRFFWARVGHDPHLVPLLQDALVMLGGTDDRLRVRLLTRLACAWRSDRERQDQRRALSQEAVDMARQLDDAATLGYALVGFCWAVWLPDNPDERLAVANEMLAVAEAAQDAERTIDAHLMLVIALMDLGRMAEARASIDTVIKLARELRQPAQLWLTWAIRASVALMEGKYALAEELMGHEIEPGHPTTPIQDDVSAARMHRWLLRREQARGTEEEGSVRASAEEFPWYPLHRSALACLLADAGRIDEARAVFDDLAVAEFGALYPDCEWLLGAALASEACAALGDASAAAVLYRQLLPFEGGHAVGHTEGSVGAVDRYLGMLAATLGREADAERHFEAGIAVNETLGAVPFAAHAQADLAALLRRRGAPADVERAAALERTARPTARRLGMVALEGRLTDVGVVEAQSAARATEPAVFRREGEYWTVAFNGRAFRMRDAKGMRYLARLLARPGEELHALDLARTADDQPATAAFPDGLEVRGDGLGDAGPRLDAEAQAAYRDRLYELRPELDAAQEAGDGERAARLKAEIDIIVGELSAAFGLGGRARKEGSVAERARQSVTKAIRDALRRIREEDVALGEHLTRAVRTGLYCSYDPDPAGAPPTWRTDRRV